MAGGGRETRDVTQEGCDRELLKKGGGVFRGRDAGGM